MPLYQRATETGIEFVNQHGVAVAGIKDDGTLWGNGAPSGAAASAVPGPPGPPGVSGPTGPQGPAGSDGAGVRPQAVAITPPKDLASTVASVRAIINVLHDAGITE